MLRIQQFNPPLGPLSPPISFSSSLSLSHFAPLFPHPAAEIVIAPANTEVAAGNTAIFTCVGLSVPPPDISWTFEGEAIANDSRTSVYSQELEENGVVFTVTLLELCGVDLEDSGTYSCVAASEGMANTTAYFQLNVLEQSKYIYYSRRTFKTDICLVLA